MSISSWMWKLLLMSSTRPMASLTLVPWTSVRLTFLILTSSSIPHSYLSFALPFPIHFKFIFEFFSNLVVISDHSFSSLVYVPQEIIIFTNDLQEFLRLSTSNLFTQAIIIDSHHDWSSMKLVLRGAPLNFHGYNTNIFILDVCII